MICKHQVLSEFPKYIIYSDGRLKGPRGFLNPGTNKGYNRTTLRKKGKKVNKFIHRLVAEAFIPNLYNKKTINHINGIKTDNRIENLEWSTASENHLHAYRVLKRKPNRPILGRKGKDCPKAKAVLQIKDGVVVKKWDCVIDTVKFGFTAQNISHCCLGKRKFHKGYQWRYL